MQNNYYNSAYCMLKQTQQSIFERLGFQPEHDYIIEDIQINQDQTIHTIFIKSKCKNNERNVYYLTHGFGGSSLMFFFLLPELRKSGDIILFDLRGMGFSSKKNYIHTSVEQIISFFVNPLQEIRRHFQHKQIILIGHSFGGYISILYAHRFPQFIKKVLAFSTIGITPKQEDYKNKIRSCSDVFHYLLSRLGWAFGLTYKTMLRYFVCCCKKAALKSSFQKTQNSVQTNEGLVQIILKLNQEDSGSEGLFFKLFQPRVLPLYDLKSLLISEMPKVKIHFIYGSQDWVDKTGASDLSKIYPQSVELTLLEGVDHQIFFEQNNTVKVIQLITN